MIQCFSNTLHTQLIFVSIFIFPIWCAIIEIFRNSPLLKILWHLLTIVEPHFVNIYKMFSLKLYNVLVWSRTCFAEQNLQNASIVGLPFTHICVEPKTHSLRHYENVCKPNPITLSVNSMVSKVAFPNVEICASTIFWYVRECFHEWSEFWQKMIYDYTGC